MNRRLFANVFAVLFVGTSVLMALPVHAADEAADTLINRMTTEALNSIKSDQSIQAGEVPRIIALIDAKLMPNMNFRRMTASAVGPAWRKATPEQQRRLQEEFKALLVRTYAGALTQVNNITITVKPLRASVQESEVLVRTEIRGRGDPIQVDYRLEKTPGEGAGWKIFDMNVMGVWLVETYRSQFAQEISGKGLDGLIATLTDRNKINAKRG
jgi:phospholipid transport system substrate-binding protein